MISQTATVLDSFSDYIQDAVKRAVAEAFDQAILQAVEDAKAKRDETIAKTTLKIMSHVSYQNIGTTLRIEVEKPGI